MTEPRKYCGAYHDRIALRAAEKIEDEFARGHAGGRGQRLAIIQCMILDLMEESTAGFVEGVAHARGQNWCSLPAPDESVT